jgi:hypothetical protein
MLQRLRRAFVAATITAGLLSATARAGTITIQSDLNTLATALGPGAPSSAVVQQLDAGNDTGLVYTPALVGGYGSFTSVPSGAPAATSVVNIPPGDGESGFFKVTFTLPSGFGAASLSGAANADDVGRVFLNGTPLSPSLLSGGAIDEYDSVTFGTTNSSLFQAGVNVLLVADDNAGGGPSAAAFYANIAYGSSVTVPEPAGLTLAGMAGIGCLVRAWRRRKAS